MKARGLAEVQLRVILTSALERGMNGLPHAPVALSSGTL